MNRPLYFPNIITEAAEKDLLEEIDKQPWLNDLSRRTQHYGFKYDYRNKSLTPISGMTTKLRMLADISQARISDSIVELPKGYFNQCIINEYKPGQGIAAHTDAKIFGDIIVSYSLLESVPMTFRSSDNKLILELARGSILILKDQFRSEWTHELGKNDVKERRVSITYRHVN